MGSNEVSNTSDDRQHVFIIGSKGIPAAYGGFETFVDKLTEYAKSDEIVYHVACKGTEEKRFRYHNADCFVIKTKDVKPQTAIYYDLAAFRYVIAYVKRHKEIRNPILYILACRIGPFMSGYAKEFRELGGQIYLNPDGHEWKRDKWSKPIKLYWKLSERLMVRSADYIICDSKTIEKYIRSDYKVYHPNTTYIAYGSETRASGLDDQDPLYQEWLRKYGLKPHQYYLVVGRFVPENNFETIIKEYMQSDSERQLVIITTPNRKLYDEINHRLKFEEDSRIQFVDSEYNQVLLQKIRECAYGYFHGHSVGGTNPSLLEALGATDVNLLFDIGFNREVAADSALYWSKEEGALCQLIERAEHLTEDERQILGSKAKKRIADAFSWEFIVASYEKAFLKDRV